MPHNRIRMTAAGMLGALSVLSVPASAATLSLRSLAQQDVRLATVAYRIGASNSERCSRPRMMTGAVFHDLTQYQPGARDAVSRAFSLRAGFGVLGTVEGGAADLAGLRTDDEIVTVAGASVEDLAAIRSDRASYHRMERFFASLEQALAGGPTTLTVRRRGKLLSLELNGQPGCGGTAALTDSSRLNAWSDGRYVVLSTAMADLAPVDDELAFVVAHEMAHNMLGHSARRARGFFGMFGFAGVRANEIEADQVAISLMNNAGYSGQGAKSFLERVRRRIWWDGSLDHPGIGRRIAIVSKAMAGLRARPAASEWASASAGEHGLAQREALAASAGSVAAGPGALRASQPLESLSAR